MIAVFFGLYELFSKFTTLAIFMCANRQLSKFEISRFSFMMSVFAFDTFLSIILFARTVNFVILGLSQASLQYFLFQWFRHYNLIGLTGTIGSGKSTLVNMVRARNKEIAIIDTDKISRKLFEKNQRFIFKVKKMFAQYEILDEKGNIDKRKIASVIFSPANAGLKKRYLRYIYMFIFWKIFVKIFRVFFMKKYVVAVIDAPMLFESVLLKYISFPIVTVYLDNEEELLRRVLLRDPGINEEDIRARVRNQMPTKKKIECSDVIICNNSSVEYLYNSFITEILRY
jgi:dephospho-CoA kinase